MLTRRVRRMHSISYRDATLQEAVDAPRVLVLSLPTLAWDDLYRGDTPAIDGLLTESSVAAMSVRNVLPETDAAYRVALAISAARSRDRAADLRFDHRPYAPVLVSSA